MKELVEKDIQRVITVFYNFQKVEKSMSILKSHLEDIKTALRLGEEC